MGFTIASFGEALWDLLPTGSVLGGAPLNFAFRANSLGNRGIIISRLGRDPLGQKALSKIKALGMDDTFVQWDNRYPTGQVEIYLDEGKHPDYTIIEDVAYDFIEFQDGFIELIKSADCLCFGTLAQRNKISRKTLWELLDAFSGQFTLLDINLRKKCYSKESVSFSLTRANVVKLNDEELMELAGLCGLEGKGITDLAGSLLEKGNLEYCVVTLGPKGAFALSKKEKVYHPGFSIDLVDPCGAGDGFSAGFIHMLLNKRPLAEACLYGNALGAMVAQQEGATQPITMNEIEVFIEEQRPGVIEEALRNFLV